MKKKHSNKKNKNTKKVIQSQTQPKESLVLNQPPEAKHEELKEVEDQSVQSDVSEPAAVESLAIQEDQVIQSVQSETSESASVESLDSQQDQAVPVESLETQQCGDETHGTDEETPIELRKTVITSAVSRDAISDSQSSNQDVKPSHSSDDEMVEGTTSINPSDVLLDDNPDDDTRLQNIQKGFISQDAAYQKGVKRVGQHIILPGRVSLLLMTLFELLFSIIAVICADLFFSEKMSNFLLSQYVLFFVMIIQITLYHWTYRAARTVMNVLITLVTIGIVAFVDWAYIDLMLFPKFTGISNALLAITAIGYTCVPMLMFLHVVYLGRGTRTIYLRQRPAKDSGE